MQSITSLFKRGLVSVAALVITVTPLLPAIAAADSSTCTPPPAQVGVNRPVGADANTYTYNCTTGLWENAYYTFSPSTGLTAPTYSIVYTYNPTTGLYNYPDWVFNAPSNAYVAVSETTPQPPAGADVVGAPAPVTPAASTQDPGDSISNTGPGSNNSITGNGSDGTGSISNTGPNSNNTLNGSNGTDVTIGNNTSATISNLLNQSATTGNSMVIGNTTAGDATSGNATDTVNAINLLQSATNALGGNALTFVANINGNVDGNLLLDPSSLGDVQPASNADPSGNTTVTINNQSNATINNNLNLDTNSGNATVANNTTGGSATSGSAAAIANVVNLIDSAITSGQSFVGEININGDLNGNIEVPSNLVNQLIASNVPTDTIRETGPNSNNTISNNSSNNTTVTNTNNEGINNNVNASSASGQASVTNNTSGGNATSGSATNTITAFNLTGSSVVGANDLLVFVNVSGTWVGMIVNAPAGATAAELGGGVTQSSNGSNNTNITNNNNQTINNNITTNANSGSASVTGNTSGGNATSGSASSAVNLLNVENSDLSLSGWFGILFINVFGTWNGSFGPESSFSNLDYAPTTASNTSESAAAHVFRFVPTNAPTSHSSPSGSAGSGTNTASNATQTSGNGSLNDILVADHAPSSVAANGAPTPQLQSTRSKIILPIIGISIFVLYAAGDITYTRVFRSGLGKSKTTK